MDNPVNPRREGKMANTASAGPHLERSLVTRSKKFAKGEMHASKNVPFLNRLASRAPQGGKRSRIGKHLRGRQDMHNRRGG
jgi:hypothetical protein